MCGRAAWVPSRVAKARPCVPQFPHQRHTYTHTLQWGVHKTPQLDPTEPAENGQQQSSGAPRNLLDTGKTKAPNSTPWSL